MTTTPATVIDLDDRRRRRRPAPAPWTVPTAQRARREVVDQALAAAKHRIATARATKDAHDDPAMGNGGAA
jgi:hypothetical protein